MASIFEMAISNAVVAAVMAIVVIAISQVSRRPALIHSLWLLVLLKLVTPPFYQLPLGTIQLPDTGTKTTVAAIEETSHGQSSVDESHQHRRTTPASMPPTQHPDKDSSPDLNEAPELSASFTDNSIELENEFATSAQNMPASFDPPPSIFNDVSAGVPQANSLTTKQERARSIPAEVVEERPTEATSVGVGSAAFPDGHFDWATLWTCLTVAWCVGSVVVLGLVILRVTRFRKLLREGHAVPPWLTAEVDQLSSRIGLRRSPHVLLVPGTISPLVWCVGRTPKLVLPSELVNSLSVDERMSVLLHELLHLRRRDHWVRLLELAVNCIYWWNPVVWWARRGIQSSEEACCDAWVVSYLTDGGRPYATALLKTVDFIAGAKPIVPPVASGLGSVKHLKLRLTQIMEGTTPRQLSSYGRLAIIILAAGLLPLWPTIGQELAVDAAVSSVNDAVPQDAATATTNTDSGEATAAPAETSPAAAISPDAAIPNFTAGFEPTEFRGTPRPLQLDVQLIRSIAYSRDGQRMVAAHGDRNTVGAIRVWDIAKKQVIAYWTEPQGVNSVHISPDGSLVASSSLSDNIVRIRNVETKEELRTISTVNMQARVRFSPDGKSLATASVNGELKLWSIADKEDVKTIAKLPFNLQCVAFSKNGARLAAGGGPFGKGKFGQAGVWETATGRQITEMKGMPDSVLGIAISPDAKLVATAGRDSIARIWDATTGKIVKTLTGHRSAIEWVDFSPDGALLSTASYDSTARIWTLKDGRSTATLTGHTGVVMSTRFSPDGKTLATAGADAAVLLWDVANNQRTSMLQPADNSDDTREPVLAIAVAPNGKLVASAHEDRTVRLRDASTGQVVRVINGHEDVVAFLAFSPDGKTLATASYDNNVKLWQVEDGSELKTLAGHTNWVFSVSFSPDGKMLASSGYDKTIRIWNVESGKELSKLEGHTAAVRSLAFSPDGKHLATGSADRTVKLWNVQTATVTKTLAGHTGSIRAVAFSADGETIASGSEDQTVKLWNMQSGKERSTLSGHTSMVWCLAFSPRGRTLASGGFDNQIKIWDPRSGRARATLKGHTDAITSIAFAPGATAIVSGSYDKTIRLWPALTPRVPPLATVELGEKINVTRFGLITPDGDRLIVGGDSPAIHVFDMKTGRLERLMEDSRRSATCGHVLPDGKRLVTGSYGEAMYLWNLETGLLLREFQSGVGRSMYVDVSTDGKRIAVAGWNKQVSVLDAETLEPIWISPEQKLPVTCAEFSPDGNLVATTTGNWKEWRTNGEVKLWDAARGQELASLAGHQHQISRAQFSPDGKLLATGGSDKTWKLWDVKDRSLLAEVPAGTAVNCLQFLPGGSSIVTGHYGGRLTMWNVNTRRSIVQYSGHSEGTSIFDVTCSADGSVLASAGAGGILRLWSTAPEPKGVSIRASTYLFKLAVSADGKRVITGGNESPKLWSAESGALIRKFSAGTGNSIAVAISADGTRALSGGNRMTVNLWDAESGAVLKQFRGHKRHVRTVAFSPDGSQALSAGLDGIAILWDLESGEELRRFVGHAQPIQWVAFSTDGSRLATAGVATTRIWNSATGKEIFQLPTGAEKSIVACVEFSPDGGRLLTAQTDGTLVLWDASTGKEVRRYRSGQTSLQAAAFMRDGRFALSGGADGRILLWDLEQETPQGQVALHGDLSRQSNAVKALAVTRDGKTVISAGEDGYARAWPLQRNTNAGLADRIRRWKNRSVSARQQVLPPQQAIKSHDRAVSALAVSRDGKMLATASRDRAVKLWDLAKRKVRTTLRAEGGGGILTAAFSPDGTLLATGSYDHTARLWSTVTGELIASFAGHTDTVRAVEFSPDGTRLFTSSFDTTLKVWDVKTRSELKTLLDTELPIPYLAVSPDGKTLATSTGIVTPRKHGKVQLWDIATGNEIRTIEENQLTSLAFSPDGKALVCRNRRGVLTVFDVATGNALRTLSNSFAGSAVRFSSDGRHVVSADYGDGMARVHDFASGRLQLQTQGTGDRLWSVTFSRDGSTLIGGVAGGEVVFWDIRGNDKQIAKSDASEKSEK